jgi:hypothetical protein
MGFALATGSVSFQLGAVRATAADVIGILLTTSSIEVRIDSFLGERECRKQSGPLAAA